MAGDTALIIAVKNKRIEAVKKLLELGAKIDRPNINSETALILAIEAKDLEMVKTLLQANASISQKYAGKTPLMWAIESKNIGIITEILNQVPDFSNINQALKTAKTDDKNKIIELLNKAQNQYDLYKLIKKKNLILIYLT